METLAESNVFFSPLVLILWKSKKYNNKSFWKFTSPLLKKAKEIYSKTAVFAESKYKHTIKADFQSVLCILESLFAFSALFHVRHHTMNTFCSYLQQVNQSFTETIAIVDCDAIYASLFLISLDETTSQR